MKPKNLFLLGSIDLTRLCKNLTKVEHLNPDVQKFAILGRNGHVYLRAALSSKKEPSQWGQTHDLKLQEKGDKNVLYFGDFKDMTKYDESFLKDNHVQSDNQPPTQQPIAQAPIQQPQNEVDTDSLPF